MPTSSYWEPPQMVGRRAREQGDFLLDLLEAPQRRTARYPAVSTAPIMPGRVEVTITDHHGRVMAVDASVPTTPGEREAGRAAEHLHRLTGIDPAAVHRALTIAFVVEHGSAAA
jgi:hypothetical protein